MKMMVYLRKAAISSACSSGNFVASRLRLNHYFAGEVRISVLIETDFIIRTVAKIINSHD